MSEYRIEVETFPGGSQRFMPQMKREDVWVNLTGIAYFSEPPARERINDERRGKLTYIYVD